MRVYLSGKIGTPDITEEIKGKFQRAALRARAFGSEVLNPTSDAWQRHLQRKYQEDMIASGMQCSYYEYVLLRDLMNVSTCDYIYMLKDYKDSPGALAELAFAKAAGKIVIYEQ